MEKSCKNNVKIVEKSCKNYLEIVEKSCIFASKPKEYAQKKDT